MDLGLRDKAFVIGGGSRGLGRAIAEQLVAEGARVLLVSRDRDAVRLAADELGERAFSHAADLSGPEAATSVASAVDAELGELDGVLVNTGGPPPGDAFELDDGQWRAAFELLLGGPIRLLRALAPKLTDGGSILFVTGSAVRQPIPGLDASNVLRPGMAALVKSLARQLAPRVRVNSIAPGRIETDRVRSLDESRAARLGVSLEEQLARAVAEIPFGRYGEAPEFARVAAFLLSPAASYVSGAMLLVDGALVSAQP